MRTSGGNEKEAPARIKKISLLTVPLFPMIRKRVDQTDSTGDASTVLPVMASNTFIRTISVIIMLFSLLIHHWTINNE